MFDRSMNPLGDLDMSSVRSMVMVEEINGEHSLSIETTRILKVGTRLLNVDDLGKWREWVVQEPDELHDSGLTAVGKYRAVWSLQNDLAETDGGLYWAAAEAGTHDPIGAAQALRVALTNSVTWRPGRCTVTETGGASLYDKSCWEHLSKVVAVWGGEVDASITVGPTGVVSRKVDLLEQLGSETAVRRFDWSRDITSIRRTPDPGPYYCRVMPRGGNEATDSDGVDYSDRCGIESVNHGLKYLQDDESAAVFRTSDGNGGWRYPEKVVIYDLTTKDDAEELINKARPDLHNHTRPGVTYEASVNEFAIAGMEVAGISLGDVVQCVDRGFSDGEALRIDGRVRRIESDLLKGTKTLTIGNPVTTIGSKLGNLTSTVNSIGNRVEFVNVVANDALSTASEAVGIANAAVETAGRAVETASRAVVTAESAVRTAESAMGVANAATQAASEAQSTADSALSTAAGAVSTANSAVTRAESAESVAAGAASDADVAVSTANAASETANEAMSVANEAATAVGQMSPITTDEIDQIVSS